jgi:hypothetical protein
MAARISSFCQGPNPLGPTKTAQVSDSAKALSMAGARDCLESNAIFPAKPDAFFVKESASQLLDARFICITMRKKDVERHLGACLPVRQSWRMPPLSILDNRVLLVTSSPVSQGDFDR